MAFKDKFLIWIANLCGGLGTSCWESEDMSPPERVEHVQDQFDENLKKFHADMLSKYTQEPPQENGPTCPNIKLIDASEERISEDVKSLPTLYATRDDDTDSSLAAEKEDEVKTMIRRCLSEDLSLEELDNNNPVLDSPTSDHFKYDDHHDSMQSLAQYSSAGSFEDISNISDSESATEVHEYAVSDDDSSEVINSVHEDSTLLGPEHQAESLQYGVLDSNYLGSLQSPGVESSKETKESDQYSTESEYSTVEEYKTSSSFVSAIAKGTSSSTSDLDISDISSLDKTADCHVTEVKLDDSLSTVDIDDFSDPPFLASVQETASKSSSDQQTISDSEWEVV